MELRQIQEKLRARVVCGEDQLSTDILKIFGADLMSDVLAYDIKPQTLLITSLVNTQVIRTADMVDLAAIVFIHGKIPNEQVISMAQNVGVPILITPMTMFECCGKLYQCKLVGQN